eukprot:scaffold762_cov363-Pavlova_lutheri.AAC.22
MPPDTKGPGIARCGLERITAPFTFGFVCQRGWFPLSRERVSLPRRMPTRPRECSVVYRMVRTLASPMRRTRVRAPQHELSVRFARELFAPFEPPFKRSQPRSQPGGPDPTARGSCQGSAALSDTRRIRITVLIRGEMVEPPSECEASTVQRSPTPSTN